MNVEFDTLYATEKNGSIRIWNAQVVKKNDSVFSIISYGRMDGKQQISELEYTSGKNIGRANETSPFQQAILETDRKWRDKMEKENYSTIQQKQTTQYFPMLAATYSVIKPKRNDITFPCFVQPKLDGLRCITYRSNGSIVTQSRTGTYFDTLSYLRYSLESLFNEFPTLILDGELYTDQIPFETLAGLIKKKKLTEQDHVTLQQYVRYHVYDIIDETLPFQERLKTLTSILQNPSWNSYLKPVETYEVHNQPEFKEYFTSFVQHGYEGIMLRNKQGLYRQGYRSNDLQKYKEFEESEYPIIGFEEGIGRDEGCVIWICKSEHKEFRVRPKGTLEQRKEWFSHGNEYIGKQLTVIYQELSEQGVPRFPVGKAVREEY